GYSVTEASSGRDALALLEGAQTLPDLMITDVSMPDMTGVALLKEIEKTGTAPRTVFMSGYANDAFDASLKDAMFLQKPFTARTLARAVRKALDE
ncbi:MAG TPA: response regulator, partial [Spirochaetia bacterium]|nr:response regulator [Spirochaetia bacterium]